MVDRYLQAAIDLAITGPGAAALSHILNVAATLTAAPSALILVRQGKQTKLLAVKGFSRLHAGMVVPIAQGHDLAYRGPAIISDAAALSVFQRIGHAPPWQWMAAIPIPLTTHPGSVALVCCDVRDKVSRPPDILANLGLLAPGVAHVIELLGLLASETNRWQAECTSGPALPQDAPLFDFASARVSAPPPDPFVAGSSEEDRPPSSGGSGVVRDFLDATLVRNVRFLQRDGMGFHALRRWRAAIKQWQLLAIKQLKQVRDPDFADMIATEMADAAEKLHGSGSATCVAAVPCGHSGSHCLSDMIGRRVAARLAVPFVEAFAPIDVRGTSHPRRNAARPAMRVANRIDKPVLLVDDIATTGSHIAEARRRLGETSPAVFSLAWLAAI